jgi:ATP-dependent helicase HrpA
VTPAAEQALEARIAAVTLADRHELERLQAIVGRRRSQRRPTSELEQRLAAALAVAEERIASGAQRRDDLRYPESLPITPRGRSCCGLWQRTACSSSAATRRRQDHATAEVMPGGRARRARHDRHTQPRELRHKRSRRRGDGAGEAGEAVGLEVRFTAQTSPTALVKVMTDGILLNEIRTDRHLLRYDTLIIDEAHERSLNIDFILGYLRRIEPQRPDLKVIITSATIDPERFARHFDGAPIIRIEGRTFPVAVHYRPRDDEQDLAAAVTSAARELAAEPVDDAAIRDMLVFCRASGGFAMQSMRCCAMGRRATRSCRSMRGSRARGSDASSSPARRRGSCSRPTSPRRRLPCRGSAT